MSKSQTLCVDASIVVRVVMHPDDPVQERWSIWSEQDARLVAPTLLLYEVVNGIYQYRKHGLIDTRLFEKTVAAAVALPVETIGGADIHWRAAVLSSQMQLPAAYDAHYLALAERLGTELWTADKRLAAAARQHGLRWVRLHE